MADKSDQMIPAEKGRPTPPDMHGAAVITDDGREIPITESMIRETLADLERIASASRRRVS